MTGDEMRDRLIKEHWCFKCYYPLSGTRHHKIDRARGKRAWRRDQDDH